MRRGCLFRIAAVVTLAAVVAGCATTHVPPISASGASFKPERDERRLWDDARDEEAKLRGKARLYDDPLLVDYLDGVVRRLNPAGMAENPEIGFHVTVIEDPTLNAFAYPTGSMYVHTGLLARMENEDQLATVLGHEMTHVENRHMLRYQRSVRNKQIGFVGAALAAAIVLAGKEGDAVRDGDYGRAARTRVLGDLILGLGLQLAFIAAVNGYGRELEGEADAGGFAKMDAAGYDTRQSARVYELLAEDHGDSGKAEAFFFGSHPRLAERIQAAKSWTGTHPPAITGGEPAAEDQFALRMRPVVRDDARLNLDAGRLEIAESELKRALAALSGDPEAQYLWARLKLKRADAARLPGERVELEKEAAAALKEALRIDPKHAGAYRESGLLAWRHNEPEVACEAFRNYLELAPKADDALRIRDYVLELERGGHCPPPAVTR